LRQTPVNFLLAGSDLDLPRSLSHFTELSAGHAGVHPVEVAARVALQRVGGALASRFAAANSRACRFIAASLLAAAAAFAQPAPEPAIGWVGAADPRREGQPIGRQESLPDPVRFGRL